MAAQPSSRAWLLGMAAGLLAALAGCASEGMFRYADAVEVPAELDQRDRLAALLAGFAQRGGLYFRDTSPRAQRLTNGRQTLQLALHRPLPNGHEWDEIAANATGNGPVWITFVRPPDEALAAEADRARAMLLGELEREWPGTAHLPLLPGGGIPRRQDVVHTAQGLRIDRDAAESYGLPADSPLLAR